MSYILKTNLADKKNYGNSRALTKIKYIVVHYTANDGDTDESNAKFFKTSGRGCSAHYFVDDDSVTMSVPNNYVAWSVGGSRYTNYKNTGGASLYKICTNTNSINIEICDTVKNGKYDISEKTSLNTIELIAGLMKTYGISISNIIRHFDVTGKFCPAYFVDNTSWEKFRKKISIAYSTICSEIKDKPIKQKSNSHLRDLQSAINADKIASLVADGIWGNSSKNAVKKCVVKNGSKGNITKWLQSKVGTNTDGIAGTKTVAAIKIYQSKKGLSVDGCAGYNTITSLLRDDGVNC